MSCKTIRLTEKGIFGGTVTLDKCRTPLLSYTRTILDTLRTPSAKLHSNNFKQT